jgi:glycosyltransferase involved in cell wall biosynthesis
VVILYSRSSWQLRRARASCSLLRIPLIVQMVEWSCAFRDATSRERARAEVFYQQAFAEADAAIVISEYLQQKWETAQSHLGRSKPCWCLPILADPDKWTEVAAVTQKRPYFVFCGDLDHYYEDALFIVKALRVSGLPEHGLVMVRKASHGTKKALREASQDMQNRVRVLSDYLPEEDLMRLYAEACALLAPLPLDDQAQARFPSKLGDYLLSGTPVVTSSVGEVARYLNDRESAFLAEPGGPESFAGKMREAALSPLSPIVAANAKRLAMEAFDYRSQTAKLLGFCYRVVVH